MTGDVCAHCGKPVALVAPVTFAVAGYGFCDRLFCDKACASDWARAEVVRLRGHLRRINSRCFGRAPRLARAALRGDALHAEEGT